MFNYHGYSGPCPKPPAPTMKVECMVEYIHRNQDGKFWIEIKVDRQPWHTIGPFDTEAERHAVHADLLNMMRSVGAKDIPVLPQ